uniref:Uncharacterized protein n=1 Tax=Romanomermis culicivorax TaxID=13658 RepID=A0A915HUC2_ROMCU
MKSRLLIRSLLSIVTHLICGNKKVHFRDALDRALSGSILFEVNHNQDEKRRLHMEVRPEDEIARQGPAREQCFRPGRSITVQNIPVAVHKTVDETDMKKDRFKVTAEVACNDVETCSFDGEANRCFQKISQTEYLKDQEFLVDLNLLAAQTVFKQRRIHSDHMKKTLNKFNEPSRLLENGCTARAWIKNPRKNPERLWSWTEEKPTWFGKNQDSKAPIS